jgi:hypothetical protein
MQTTFTLQKGKCHPPPPIQINHTTIQQKDQAKDLLDLPFTASSTGNNIYPHEKETNGSKSQRPILAL